MKSEIKIEKEFYALPRKCQNHILNLTGLFVSFTQRSNMVKEMLKKGDIAPCSGHPYHYGHKTHRQLCEWAGVKIKTTVKP